jgi:hypothetical protein
MPRSAKEGTLRIEITEEQQKQIQQATGKQVSALTLKLELLEERVAPKLAAN